MDGYSSGDYIIAVTNNTERDARRDAEHGVESFADVDWERMDRSLGLN
jgi:hypothetical protein